MPLRNLLLGSLLVRAPDPWSKGCEFESLRVVLWSCLLFLEIYFCSRYLWSLRCNKKCKGQWPDDNSDFTHPDTFADSLESWSSLHHCETWWRTRTGLTSALFISTLYRPGLHFTPFVRAQACLQLEAFMLSQAPPPRIVPAKRCRCCTFSFIVLSPSHNYVSAGCEWQTRFCCGFYSSILCFETVVLSYVADRFLTPDAMVAVKSINSLLDHVKRLRVYVPVARNSDLTLSWY